MIAGIVPLIIGGLLLTNAEVRLEKWVGIGLIGLGMLLFIL